MKVTFLISLGRSQSAKRLQAVVTERVCVLGRKGCHIALNDQKVSRQHAAFVAGEDLTLMVRDLESKNGTFVNGSPVKSARLQKGDEVRIGDHLILIERLEESSPEEEADEVTNIGFVPSEHEGHDPRELTKTELNRVQQQVVRGWPGAFMSMPEQGRGKFTAYVPTKSKR